MYNLAQCTADFKLSLTILTQWCLHAYDINYNGTTNIEIFIINNCCPSALNVTTHQREHQIQSETEQFATICGYLSSTEEYRDEYNKEKCSRTLKSFKTGRNQRAEYSGMLELCFYSIVIPIGFIANLLVILTINQTIRSHNFLSMMFIRNLAIADLIGLLGFVASTITYNEHKHMPKHVYQYLFPTFDIFSGTLSLNSVMMISIDRAVAVVYPVRHFSGANNWKGKFYVLVMWSFSLLLLLLSLSRIWILDELYRLCLFYGVAVCFFLPCFLVFVSYIVIIAFTIRSNRQLVRANARRNSITLRGISRFREIKLAINVTVIILPLMLGWGFVGVVNVCKELQKIELLLGVHSLLLIFIPITFSSINPLIYLMLTSSLRKNSVKTISRMCFCWHKKRLKFIEGRLLARSISRGSSKVTEVSALNEELPNDLNDNNI